MGQTDIYKLLLKNRGKRYDVKQIAKKLDVNRTSITKCLNRMISRCDNPYGLKFKLEGRHHGEYTRIVWI